MDSAHLIIQMLLHVIPLLKSPFIKELPDLMTVGTAEPAVFITSFILAFKCIDAVFLLMELLACKGSHCIAVVEIIPGVNLLFHQVLVLRQVQILYCKFIRQIDNQRISQFFIKILLYCLKCIRKIFLAA